MGACSSGGKRETAAVQKYFDRKVVWITGASSGLGEALCIALARVAKPEAIILSARRPEELDRVSRHCKRLSANLKTAVLPLDLTEVGGSNGTKVAARLAEEATCFFGRVDVLVNNGGVGFRGMAADTTLETDRRIMDTNYFSGVALTKALLPSWRAESRGHMVFISSVQGYFGLPCRTAYSASKHAILGFCDALRAEVADDGITVTAVAPGYISTGHSVNALTGDGSRYAQLDDSTKKGVAPEVLARKLLVQIARCSAEFVPAPLDARFARWLRTFCPRLYFAYVQRRARKERAAVAAASAAS